MTRILIATGAMILTGMAVYAMTDLDTDADGGVSLQELQAAHPEVTEDQFQSADTNGDGMIDEIELSEARAAGILPADQG